MSDPKHLPPRDCLVLLDFGENVSIWIHVEFQEADGEYDEDGHARGHNDRWVEAGTSDELELDRVITWRELPEVE